MTFPKMLSNSTTPSRNSDMMTLAQITAEYAASPALQQEFGSLETYQAFRRAELAGQVKIHSTRKTASVAADSRRMPR